MEKNLFNPEFRRRYISLLLFIATPIIIIHLTGWFVTAYFLAMVGLGTYALSTPEG
jgi:hypothetical protein